MLVRLKSNETPNGLSPQKDYVVLGIESDYYRLLNDHREPILFAPRHFVITDPSEPDFWVRQVEDGATYAYPPDWCHVGFFEDWHDGLEGTRQIFKTVLAQRYGIDLQSIPG